MKRALIVLLLLAVVAGGLFAQISFWGRASSGLEVAIEDDTTFHIYNHRDRGGMYKFEFDASYTTESGRVGGYGGLDVTDGNIGGWDANVWFKPIDILKVVAGGGVYNWAWDTGGSLGTRTYTGNGVMFYLDPIAGLNVYAGVQPAGAEFGDTAFSLGARYTATDLLRIAGTIKYDGAANDGDGKFDAAAGVDVIALGPTLGKVAVDILAENVQKLSELGAVSIGPRINYNVAGFSGYVRSNINIPVTDAQKDQGLNLKVGVRGQYDVVSGVTVRLDAGYGLKGKVSDTNGSAFNFNTGWSQVPNAFISADTSVVGVQPAVLFNIDGKTLEVGYGLLTQIGGDSKMKSAIYANFVVGF